MNKLQIFNNPTFGEIRTIEEEGKVLFCGIDVARSLGYVNTRDAINRHCKGVVKRDTPTSSGKQSMSFVSEGDIYRLAAKSELPGAEAFESWIFDEVLPSIRRTGAYRIDETRQALAEAKLNNSRARIASLWVKLADKVPSPAYQQICASYASNVLAGREVIPLPVSPQKHYTATEIGEMFGISKQRVGSIAVANGLKIDEYGAWYHDKSPYSSKEVDTFKYNDKAVQRFREILGAAETA